MAYKKFYTKQLILTVLLILYVCCLFLKPVKAEIRSRGANSVNTNSNKNKHEGQIYQKSAEDNNDDDVAASSKTTATSSHVNTDFVDKLSWKCANNASCLYSLASGILSSYRRGETVKFGFLDLVKLHTSTHKTKSNFNSAETGRSMSTFVDFISGNAIRIPVGPMVFSVQRAEDDDNYIEVALLKKARSSTARLGGNGGGGGGGGDIGSLLSGGGDNGGGGHNIMQRIREHKDKDDKKQMQMYIPMYLAATTFGWTMVAAKAVGLLTLKALAISKIAFVVAAMVLMKKLMENATDNKMMYQYPEQSPYMMPYSMDYGMHSMAAAAPDMATAADMYGAGVPMHAPVAPLQAHQGIPGYEHLTAESTVHQNIADIQNNTQVLAALNAAGLGAKVKREDSWLARKPFRHFAPYARLPFKRLPHFITKQKFNLNEFKSYDDLITVAAVAAAEVVVDENEKRLRFKSDFFGEDIDEDEEDDDNIFNGEEDIKDTLQFLANVARRPMVYNYLNPHTAYYRQ